MALLATKSVLERILDPASRVYYYLRWLIMLALGLAIYYQTFVFGFVFDDNEFIVRNPYIRDLARLNELWAVLPKTRLVGMLSFAGNYAMGRLDPQGYHIFNFLVHLAATGLVWGVASALFRIVGLIPSSDHSRREIPFFAALIFLVHPCQIQAVTYVSQRFESMATVFYLISFYAYLRGRLSASNGHRAWLFVLAAGAGVLGLFTKEIVVTLPLMILACELILPREGASRRTQGDFFWRCIGLVIAGAAFCFILMRLLKAGPGIFFLHIPSESHTGDIITTGNYILTQMRVFLTFLQLLILPAGQNLDHDFPLSAGLLQPPLTLIGLIVIGVFCVLIVRLRRTYPLIAFGLAWMLVTFSINLVPRANVISEHKLYLISFGFILAMLGLLMALVRRRTVLIGLLTGMIVVLAWLSFERNQVWQNEFTLWEDVLKRSPRKARPYVNHAVACNRRGDFIRAEADCTRAIGMEPANARAYHNRAVARAGQGRLAEAVADGTKAIALWPHYAEAYYNRGLVHYMQGDLARAVSDYTQAIANDPYYGEAYNNRAVAFYKQGQAAKAMADWTRALELDPDNVQAQKNRAAYGDT